MKKLIIYTIILTIFLTTFCFAESSLKETELLFMARKAYEDGFYEVSLGILERFQKEYNNSAELKEVMLLSGQCYFQQGRYLESLNIFEKLLTDVQNVDIKDAVYFWLAEVHFKGGNFDKAAGFYQKLINDFPQSAYTAAAYYSLGWSLSEMGKYSLAVQTFKSLLEKFPSEPQSKDAAFKLIECLYNLKEYTQLRDKVKPILKLYINDRLRLPYLYFYLGEAEYYLENFEQAAKNYLKSAQISKEPKVQALANLGLGWSYLKLTKYKEAENILTQIKQNILDKKSLDTLLLGQALLMSSTNRIYESKKLYEQLITVSSDPLICAQAYLGKADALCNLAEYSQAVEVYKEGLEKIKTFEQGSVPQELTDKLRYNLGLAYIKTGKASLGKDIFDNMVGRNDDQSLRSSLLFQVGQSYEEAKDFVNAREAYQKILKLYPDSVYVDYAQFQLGSLQLKSTELDQAIDTFEQILKKYPQSKLVADSVYSLGVAYFQKNEFLKSKEFFSKFQNEFKDSPLRGQAVYMLGVSYLSLGKVDQALIIFKEVVKNYAQDAELLPKAEYEIADCYAKLGQEEEAFRLFKLLRAKYPNSDITAEVLWWLGQYYYRNNNLVLARRYFDALTKDLVDNRLSAQAFYAMGLTFADENKAEQAVKNFKTAIKLGDVSIKSAATLALAKNYYKLGDYDQAKLYYSQSLNSADLKNVAAIRFNLAETLEANSEFESAIKQYLLAADLSSDSPQLSTKALLRVAKIYEDKENFLEALKIYKRVISGGSAQAMFAQERVEAIGLRK
ncbi:MAG: tetratricopeptide repeat protein [Candidatus Omnitrophota bacterium]